MDKIKSFLNNSLDKVEQFDPGFIEGTIKEVKGILVKAVLPGCGIGDLVTISSATKKIRSEVVGFEDDEVLLAPLDRMEGINSNWKVKSEGGAIKIPVGMGLKGRILDGLGRPIDGEAPIKHEQLCSIYKQAPHPLKRPLIQKPLITGIRAVDGFLTLGLGQRAGLFAGSGVGKSFLMGILARRSTADVNVVCLVGERGREVREFITNSLGDKGLKKSVIVAATSDKSSLVRSHAPRTATTIAEYFRDQGLNVLLLVDSLTRFARATRETALSLGEPPARRGYPPSIFAKLPALLERTGTSEKGSITAIYTVLVEGGDMEEPIADEVRGIVDGHMVLSRELAVLGHYPAISISQSISRLMTSITDKEHQNRARKIRSLIGALEQNNALIKAGAYEKGNDPTIDQALQVREQIEQFLIQGDSFSPLENTIEQLGKIVESAVKS
ncbi:MAG: FliI/YscN family ATPase [Deltaproteobacteria bacterium]|nr:FliI/YscN family ATPase [Deltaproteobacteria bacterium]